MEFTGERLVPTAAGQESLFEEHIARYLFVAPLVRGRRVLDAGCGCGYGSYHLARTGARSVLGVDVSQEAVDYAREHYRHECLSFLRADVRETGLDAASVDAVVTFEVFEHMEGPERFLAEVGRVLVPDGILVVSTPNALTYRAGGEVPDNPYHVREYTPDEFRSLLGAVFPETRLYVQSRWSGLAILPVSPETAEDELPAGARRVLPSSSSTWGEPAPARATAERGDYLLAVCSARAGGLRGLPPAAFYAFGEDLVSPDAERARAVREIETLRGEFDERGRWAQTLQEELGVRDRTIRTLQQEFEDRTRWALELDRKVEEQARLIETLRAPCPKANA